MSPEQPVDHHAAKAVSLVAEQADRDSRLDVFLARHFPQHSRTHLRRAINAMGVRVNGQRAKASHRLQPGERVEIVLPELPREGPEPEEIPLSVLYEDDWLAVIDKPPGMVVHPGRGHWAGTLTSALQFRFNQLSSVGGPSRPGIVHRLDRDTSGVIVVARHDEAHQRLAAQWESRNVEKEYAAITVGAPDHDRDRIDLPIGPHPYQREKMAVRPDHPQSRPAETFYEVERRFDGFALVRCFPRTGRTHQIRLHLAAIGCPVACDRLYGGRARLTRGDLLRQPGADDTPLMERQALHARRLRMTHPATGEPLEFESPLPADFLRLLAALDALRPARPPRS